jgi:hypothetical protein
MAEPNQIVPDFARSLGFGEIWSDSDDGSGGSVTPPADSTPGAEQGLGGQGGRGAPLVWRFLRIPTHFPLNSHAI